jgi:hypothetical protein
MEAYRHHANMDDFSGLPQKMGSYVDYIQRLAKATSELGTDRLPTTKDYALFFLHVYVLKATGKPQWKNLATLLEAASYASNGREIEMDDDSLRKRMMGLRIRAARACSNIERRAENDIASGNGSWVALGELDALAVEVAIQVADENSPETKTSK